MSSGKLEENYLKNVESSFRFNDSAIFNNYNLQQSKFSEQKLYEHDLIKDNKSILKHLNEGVKKNHFNMIKEIHNILKSSKNLTQNQKFAYCNSQRFFMKLYLKRISRER
ncbi:MAG: hypothetical protein ACFE9Q_01020 [Candidatus Hodarchaeota archaeon]